MVAGEGTRGTLVIWVIAAVLGGMALIRLAGCGGDAGRSGGVRIARSPEAGAASSAPSRRAGSGIYVHVAGAVRRPGLLRLRDGTRVAVAVHRAGGPLRQADLAGVNLAATLEDGQQVIVPRRGAVPPATGPAATGTGAAPPPGSAGVPRLSLAAVTVEQLDQLDGIGPTLAQRIVEYRTEHGSFRSLGELREVEGIGEKRFESLSKALQP